MSRPLLSIIAAIGQNRVIGKDNQLPWSLPDDQSWFRRITDGKPFVMGRNSYQSADAFLSSHRNFILSRRSELDPLSIGLCENCVLVSNLESAIEEAQKIGVDEVFVIGGASVYEVALPMCNRLYLTMVDASPDGDAFFPEIKWEEWKEISSEFHPADAQHEYSFWFRVFDRIQ
jgi:dihydrofolate reductase